MDDDPAGQPLLAGLCALARDPVFRASAQAIFESEPGDEVTSADLADAVEKSFPDSYNEATLAKIGRNTVSSWEQTGHLEAVARTTKVRRRAVCTPATTAFALFLGHLEGLAGAALFDTVWARASGSARARLIDLAMAASQRSLIDFRHSGGITEVRLHRAAPADGRAAVVSRVDDLIANYQRFAKLPWPSGLAPAQRVWMAVYAPEDERRFRLHLQEFETASNAAGHEWALDRHHATRSRSGWPRTSTATPTSPTRS